MLHLPRGGKENFSKGIIGELNDFRKEKKMLWDKFYQWVTELCYDASMSPSISDLKVSLDCFDSKRRSLRRNKQWRLLYDLMSEPFLGKKVLFKASNK